MVAATPKSSPTNQNACKFHKKLEQLRMNRFAGAVDYSILHLNKTHSNDKENNTIICIIIIIWVVELFLSVDFCSIKNSLAKIKTWSKYKTSAVHRKTFGQSICIQWITSIESIRMCIHFFTFLHKRFSLSSSSLCYEIFYSSLIRWVEVKWKFSPENRKPTTVLNE